RISGAAGKATSVQIDVRSTAAVDAMVAAVVRDHGRLDVLLTTPAVNLRKRLLDYSDEEFDRVIELNLKGTFRVARACARPMMEKKRGSIILMSSIRSVTVEPGQSIYASTKAGVAQMMRGLACELGPSGVRVNALAPGIVATPLTRPIAAGLHRPAAAGASERGKADVERSVCQALCPGARGRTGGDGRPDHLS